MDIKPLDFFALRRPLMPVELLLEFNSKICQHPESLEEELTRLFSQPLMAEAVYLASPGLYSAFLDLETTHAVKSRGKIMSTLYKYFIRMCTRATPYGLFAGITTGNFSDKTAITFADQEPFLRYSRLDTAVAARIADSIENIEYVRNQTLFYPNSSMYQIGGMRRFVERLKSPRGHQNLLSGLHSDPTLEKVLASCERGATISQMVLVLSNHLSRQHASAYIEELIGMQLLISELEINVTGDPYLDVLAGKLKRMQHTQPQIDYLDQIRALMRQDSQHNQREQLSALLNVHAGNLESYTTLHTDLYLKTSECSINRRWPELLLKEFTTISCLLQTIDESSDLSNFKRAFIEKYGDKHVPLLEALDCETGIGYGPLVPGSSDRHELLEDLHFPDQPQPSISLTPSGRLKEKLADRAILEAVRSITLNKEDVADLPSERLPDYFYWLGSFLTSPDTDDFQFLLRAMGSGSGLELLGRFCYADAELLERVKNAAAVQQASAPEVIFAEIAHLPDSRAANIISRPHIRDYEIIYMAAGNLPEANRIYASDLTVSIPDGKQVVLTSKKLNKRIVPCLASAHNFTNGLPVYQFLCDLAGQQHTNYSGWQWGQLENRSFLPRIQYGRLILSRAMWNITIDQFPDISDKAASFEQVWQGNASSPGIPRYFQICQGDHELFIDAHCPASQQVLVDLLHSEKRLRLVEVLQSPDQGMLKAGKQTYYHEVVFPFAALSQAAFLNAPSPPDRNGEGTKTDFPLGSPWLYVKVFIGTRTADDMLSEIIGRFCSSLIDSGQIEKWFFVRYQDPEPHIRLRFYHSKSPNFWYIVLQDLHQQLSGMLDSGLISSVQTDIYKREVRRYAGLAFEDIESIFYVDSLAVLGTLSAIQRQNEPNRTRWLAGLYGADRLMDDLGMLLPEKLEMVANLGKQFFSEIQGDTALTVQLNNQFRKHKTIIVSFMNHPPEEFSELFRLRSQQIAQALHLGCQQVTELPMDLRASLVHMFFNRLLVSQHRRQELVMYHYLTKYYKSLIKSDKKWLSKA